MFTCHYRVDFGDEIFTFQDDYNWDIWDSIERSHLFADLGYHNYDKDPSIWRANQSHEIIICKEDGVPIRGMIVNMYLEPAFEAEEKYPELEEDVHS